MSVGLPLLLLGALAVIFPLAFLALFDGQRWATGKAALASTLALIGVVSGYFATLYYIRDPEYARALLASPALAAGQFLKLSALSALLWGPLLAFTLFRVPPKASASR